MTLYNATRHLSFAGGKHLAGQNGGSLQETQLEVGRSGEAECRGTWGGAGQPHL